MKSEEKWTRKIEYHDRVVLKFYTVVVVTRMMVRSMIRT